MALINCPECDREISENAKACPGCGEPVGRKRRPSSDTLFGILTCMLFAGALAWILVYGPLSREELAGLVGLPKSTPHPTTTSESEQFEAVPGERNLLGGPLVRLKKTAPVKEVFALELDLGWTPSMVYSATGWKPAAFVTTTNITDRPQNGWFKVVANFSAEDTIICDASWHVLADNLGQELLPGARKRDELIGCYHSFRSTEGVRCNVTLTWNSGLLHEQEILRLDPVRMPASPSDAVRYRFHAGSLEVAR